MSPLIPSLSMSGRGLVLIASVLLLLAWPSPSASVSSKEPQRFKMDRATFVAPLDSSGTPKVEVVDSEVLGVTVDIDDVVPFLSPNPESPSFSPLCASVTSELESCSKSGDVCPINIICSERMEYLASRSARLAYNWNETLAKDKGFGIR